MTKLRLDDDIRELLQNESARLSFLFTEIGQEEAEHDSIPRLGFALSNHVIDGRALLSERRQNALNLVKRLKDSGGTLSDEVEFWSSQLVLLARSESIACDLVTNPPASGKSDYHLATDLARRVARILNLEYKALFENRNPRGHRASIQEKLREIGTYQIMADVQGKSILVVDDMYCTGRTMLRCKEAASKARLWALLLCVS